ncbi:MAG: sulfite exporter TauE/SafE family protein [Planctomycetota bacterium]
MTALGLTLLPDQVTSAALFFSLGSSSAAVFSMSKAGFGSGLGLLAVPLMVFATGDTVLATGIMLPMLIVADYVAMGAWWRRWNVKAVGMTLPGVLLGVGLGWGAIVATEAAGGGSQQTTEGILKILIGVIALGFVSLQLIRALRGKPITLRPGKAQASAAGGIAGFTSTLAHAGGPIAAMYFLPQQMPKQQYVATTAMFFWMTNQIKLPVYYFTGRMNVETLGAGVLLLPAILVGAVLGRYLHNRFGKLQFLGIVYGLLALAGGGLIYKGVDVLLKVST